MSAIPLVAWVTRGVRAQVEEFARREGVSIEEACGDLVAAEVRRRSLPPPDLPDLPQPSRETTARALAEDRFVSACGGPERADAYAKRFQAEEAEGPRKACGRNES